MRSAIYGPDVILLASKKPRIKELVKNCLGMTEEEIKNLPERPDVIRGLLLIKNLGSDKLTVGEKVANAMQQSHVGQIPGENTYCDIFQITTVEPFWLDTYTTAIEVCPGWYWSKFTSNNKLLYVGGSPILPKESTVEKLLTVSAYIKCDLFSEFKRLEYERRQTLS